MFKKSFVLVALVFLSVVAATYTSGILTLQKIPSTYDPGLSIQEAVQTSKTPLLVEFYTDSCTTCQHLTPVLHKIYDGFENRLTLVMLDMDNPDNQMVGQLFGVSEVPAVFVFDFKHMKKHPIATQSFASPEAVQQKLHTILENASRLSDRACLPGTPKTSTGANIGALTSELQTSASKDFSA